MAKNDIQFNIHTNVDGQQTVATAITSVKDLGKAADQTGKEVSEMGSSFGDLSRYRNTFGDIVESSKPLKRQLGELKKLMAEMEFRGLAGTDEFKMIAEQAGAMADAIGDANAQVQYMANDTRVLQSVVGAFNAVASSISLVQGAMALFGAESKEAALVLQKVQGAMALANGVQQISNLLNKDSALIQGMVNLQRKLAASLARKHAAAVGAETAATKGATVATKALNVVMKANPIGLVITAITTLIGLFAIFSSKSDESTDKMKKQGEEVDKLTGSWSKLGETVGNAAGETVSKFQTLALQWSLLRTEGERQQWITKNASNFEQLGLKIMDVTTANKVFIEQLPRMITLMQKMGELKGLEAAYSQVQSDYFSWLLKREKSRATGDYYTKATQQNITKSEREELGIGTQIWVQDPHSSSAGVGTGFFSYEYSAAELQRVNEYRERQAKETRDAILKQAKEEYGASSKEYERLYKSLYGEVSSAAEELNKLFGQTVVYNPATTASPYGKTSGKGAKAPSTSAPKTKSAAPKIKQAVQKDVKDIKQLTVPVDGMQLEFDGDFVITPDSFKKAMEGGLEDVSTDLTTPIIFDPRKAMSFEEGANFDRKMAVQAGATSGIEDVKGWFDAGLIGREKAQEFIDTFNEQLKSVGLEPIEVNLKADQMRQQITTVTDTVNILASSLGTAFGAFNSLMKGDGEDEYGLMVGKIIAQTIATLSLSFAQAMKSASSNWVTWLAFGLTGAAQLTSMIAQIRGLNSEGYATGGIIPGSSMTGDRVLARVNSGEMILNTMQQRRLFGMLNGTIPAAQASPTASLGILRNSLNTGRNVTFTVSGRNLVGVMSNETRISSRSGRKTNIKI